MGQMGAKWANDKPKQSYSATHLFEMWQDSHETSKMDKLLGVKMTTLTIEDHVKLLQCWKDKHAKVTKDLEYMTLQNHNHAEAYLNQCAARIRREKEIEELQRKLDEANKEIERRDKYDRMSTFY
jgi:hypothetical protein